MGCGASSGDAMRRDSILLIPCAIKPSDPKNKFNINATSIYNREYISEEMVLDCTDKKTPQAREREIRFWIRAIKISNDLAGSRWDPRVQHKESMARLAKTQAEKDEGDFVAPAQATTPKNPFKQWNKENQGKK